MSKFQSINQELQLDDVNPYQHHLTEQLIRSYLPFDKHSEAWRRLKDLEAEDEQIVKEMARLVDEYRQTISEPREIYLTVQEVRSRTVYVRWRRRGVRGKQAYLLLNSVEGRDFLLRQSKQVQKLLIKFDQWALSLNLAHSLRLLENKRIRQYLDTLTGLGGCPRIENLLRKSCRKCQDGFSFALVKDLIK